MAAEMKGLLRSWWWCGGGLAVLVLAVSVAAYRHPSDWLFWAALAFLAVHIAGSSRRYVLDRRLRSRVEVSEQVRSAPVQRRNGNHYNGHNGHKISFSPAPVTSLIPVEAPYSKQLKGPDQ